jgi:hypothetical protein
VQKILETIILNNKLATKYIYSEFKEDVAASGTDTISIKPTHASEIWVMTKLMFGNINSDVWEVTINHKSFESFSEQTVQASFIEEVVETWIEIVPAQPFDIKLKNTDGSTQSFDITAYVLVFTSRENYETVKRMITGVSSLLSMLGFISPDPALHKHLMVTAISKLLSSPVVVDAMTEEVVSGQEPPDQEERGITLFEDDLEKTSSPGFIIPSFGEVKKRVKSFKID